MTIAAALLRQDVQLWMVRVVYPGFEVIVNTRRFRRWFRAQRPSIQRLASSERAVDAIRLLDMFFDEL